MLSPSVNEINDSNFSSLVDKFVVIEEKIDGINSCISFDNNADISLQTRTHANPNQFKKLHEWASGNVDKLFDILGSRYMLFGEYCYAKHTSFYDNLCHYFLESDIYDKTNGKWLSTYRRQELLSTYGKIFGTNNNIVCSVPIIKIGKVHSRDEIKSYIIPSFCKTEKWKIKLEEYCEKYHYDFVSIMKQTDDSILSEGVYIKQEDKDYVVDRFKFTRKQFLDTKIKLNNDRPIIPNIAINDNV